MGAAEDNWLCETVVARRDDDPPTVDLGRAEPATLDMGRARRKEAGLRAAVARGLGQRPNVNGTAVMLRPLGLAPMRPRVTAKEASPPRSSEAPPAPASGALPKAAARAAEWPAQPPASSRPSYERRAVWVVSALLVLVFAWRAVPIAAARLSDVAAKLSTPSDP